MYYVFIVISHAMARDGSSGGVIRLVMIDQSGVEKEVVLGIMYTSVCIYMHCVCFIYIYV